MKLDTSQTWSTPEETEAVTCAQITPGKTEAHHSQLRIPFLIASGMDWSWGQSTRGCTAATEREATCWGLVAVLFFRG